MQASHGKRKKANQKLFCVQIIQQYQIVKFRYLGGNGSILVVQNKFKRI